MRTRYPRGHGTRHCRHFARQQACLFQNSRISGREDGVPTAVLSRRAVQEACKTQYIAGLQPGDVIDACVTRLEPFGAFCDIGAGLPALLPIDSISVSRIPHPNVRFTVGQQIRAVLKGMDENGRITLSHKELLGTWEENAARFRAGETVPGIVRSIEKYGILWSLRRTSQDLRNMCPVCRRGTAQAFISKASTPTA